MQDKRRLYSNRYGNSARILLLHTVCQHWIRDVKIDYLEPRDDGEWERITVGREGELTYESHASDVGPKRLNEVRAMIDASDILLCVSPDSKNSGLNYARKKHLPVINLSDNPAEIRRAIMAAVLCKLR